jgi:hypothetical protein
VACPPVASDVVQAGRRRDQKETNTALPPISVPRLSLPSPYSAEPALSKACPEPVGCAQDELRRRVEWLHLSYGGTACLLIEKPSNILHSSPSSILCYLISDFLCCSIHHGLLVHHRTDKTSRYDLPCGSNDKPSGLATTGSGISNPSLKNACQLIIVEDGPFLLWSRPHLWDEPCAICCIDPRKKACYSNADRTLAERRGL